MSPAEDKPIAGIGFATERSESAAALIQAQTLEVLARSGRR
jgi:hypothetical protein